MRGFAFAAMIGIGLAIAAAEARPWADPAGRITIDVPNSWVVSSERTEGFSHVIAGNANNECQFVITPNPGSASGTVDTARRTALNDAQFTDAAWVQMSRGLGSIFPNNSVVFISRTRDDSGPWPVQRAELQSTERQVHAGLQLRPGFDILGFCMTYGGADPIAVYDNVLRTMGHPNDATFLAEGQRQAAEREARTAAAEATTAAAAAAAAERAAAGERRRRNN